MKVAQSRRCLCTPRRGAPTAWPSGRCRAWATVGTQRITPHQSRCWRHQHAGAYTPARPHSFSPTRTQSRGASTLFCGCSSASSKRHGLCEVTLWSRRWYHSFWSTNGAPGLKRVGHVVITGPVSCRKESAPAAPNSCTGDTKGQTQAEVPLMPSTGGGGHTAPGTPTFTVLWTHTSRAHHIGHPCKLTFYMRRLILS